MNNGAFGENFPYSNFHDLNMDWIIKIAKDFLDQYTHIQQIIADGETSLGNKTIEGIQQLEDKASDLENLLNEWYTTHSEDIANELADALADINSTLNSAISTFTYNADTEVARLIATIPSDYTQLSEAVNSLQTILGNSINLFNGHYYSGIPNQQAGQAYGTNITPNASYGYTELIPVKNGSTLYVVNNYQLDHTVYVRYYDSSKNYISDVFGVNLVISSYPSNAEYFAVTFQVMNLNILTITYDTVPICPISYEITKYPEYMRLDQGITPNHYPNGSKLFPLTQANNILCTYPMKVPANRNVFFHNEEVYSWTVKFYDNNGNYINADFTMTGGGSHQVTVPSNAVSMLGYANIQANPKNYCFVNGTSEIAYVPKFGETISITALKGKRVVMVGDSIVKGLYFGGGFPTILNQVYDTNCENEGHDGFVITRDPNYPNDSLLDVLDSVTGDVDILIISGGINDVSRNYTEGTLPEHTYDTVPNETTFCNALFSYLKMAHNKFPTAKIMYMLTSYKNWNDSTFSERQRRWWKIIRTACNMFSIDIIDLANNGGLLGTTVTGITDTMTETYYLNQDGTHPNWEGYKYLFPYIANSILKHIN